MFEVHGGLGQGDDPGCRSADARPKMYYTRRFPETKLRIEPSLLQAYAIHWTENI